MELGRMTNDPRPRAMALWALAILDAFYFNFEDAIASADESIAIGLCPVDHLAAQGGRGIAMIMMGRADEGLDILRQARPLLDDGGLVIPLNSGDPPMGLGMVLVGEIAGGIGWIEETKRRLSSRAAAVGVANCDLFLGAIFLEMAVGENKPPFSVMRRNFWFLMRTLPFAAAKARRHLESAAAFYREHDMPALLAWALTDLGRLHTAKKRRDQARACLDEARPVAEAIEEPVMVERIDKVLATLDAV
jgi:hypothetical protein